MNPELRELFEADQADRQQAGDLDGIAERDRVRRERAAELFESGEVVDADDFFHAAMLFQHGDSLQDYQRAHELALRAHELGHAGAAWLAAAAFDRWLVNQGRPQKFGTQFKWDARRQRWTLGDVDPQTTDEERARWNVPSLAESERRGLDLPKPKSDTLAEMRIPGLQVVVIRTEAEREFPRMPLIEAGFMRLAEGDGPVIIGWREGDPNPRLERVALRGGDGVAVHGMPDGQWYLAVRRGDTRWLVFGTMPLDQLRPLVERLPG